MVMPKYPVPMDDLLLPNHPPEAVIMNSIDEAENEDERDIDELKIMSKLQLLAGTSTTP